VKENKIVNEDASSYTSTPPFSGPPKNMCHGSGDNEPTDYNTYEDRVDRIIAMRLGALRGDSVQMLVQGAAGIFQRSLMSRSQWQYKAVRKAMDEFLFYLMYLYSTRT